MSYLDWDVYANYFGKYKIKVEDIEVQFDKNSVWPPYDPWKYHPKCSKSVFYKNLPLITKKTLKVSENVHFHPLKINKNLNQIL